MTNSFINNKIWIPAPPPQSGGALTAGDITGVYIDPHETVRWTWLNGRVVGYTILPALFLVKNSATGPRLEEIRQSKNTEDD